jgi:hypothetical protein
MKMKNAMSMFAVLSLVTGCAASTQPTAEPEEGTAEVATELAAPAARDTAAEEQAVVEAPIAQAVVSCTSGTLLCCQSVQSSSSPTVSLLLGLLGIVTAPNIPVGLTCSPIANGDTNSCSANPVCCENANFNGLIALGCTPAPMQ